MTQIATIQPHEIEGRSNAITPLDMLNRAVASGANIETLEKLMGLHERWEAAQARRAFDEAIAGAKAEIRPVVRNAKGHNDKRYADFAAIAKAVDTAISQVGLSYRFRTRQDERIHVTCILSHKDGHSEETTLSGPADSSGNKNAIQAIGSTLTYLQRYTLVQMLGLAASDQDDDGKAAGAGATISDEQVQQLQDLIIEVGADPVRFLKFAKIDRLENLAAVNFDAAVKLLKQKEQRR